VASHAELKLSRLRDIGWSEWDPIGLLPTGGNWVVQPCADEYDSYLLNVARQLQDGWNIDEATTYLRRMEIDQIGMSETATTLSRARATAEAIRAYLDGIGASN
jgi:hypothetical protein